MCWWAALVLTGVRPKPYDHLTKLESTHGPIRPRTRCARARHDDTPGRPHDLGHRPLSQRSFLWPKRLTAGDAAAKEASSGAVGPGEALGTLVTISGYVKRPRYARLNTPMGADGTISCMSCASYLRGQSRNERNSVAKRRYSQMIILARSPTHKFTTATTATTRWSVSRRPLLP